MPSVIYLLFIAALQAATFWPISVLADELYSFSVMVMPPPVVVTEANAHAPYPICDGVDRWIDVQTGLTGAGVFPREPVIIVGTQLWSFFAHPRSYLMIGATPPNEDAITPYVFGTSTMPPVFFPAGHGFGFDPAKDHLHVHYYCPPGDRSPQFGFTLFYVHDKSLLR
jgi:hypothetical protein